MIGWKNAIVPVCVILIAQVWTIGSTDLTTHVLPGKEECFFENGVNGKTLAIDYTVISASQGNLDINFQVFDPHNRPIVSEFRKAESAHNIPIHMDGVYRMCFDNTFSHFSVKSIAFGITVESLDESNWVDTNDVAFAPEGQYDMRVEDIQDITNRVRIHFSRITRLQEEFREVETRDRSTIEQNYERVNFWSCVNVFVMLVVGFLQTIIVKGLFDDGRGIPGKLMGKVAMISRSLKG